MLLHGHPISFSSVLMQGGRLISITDISQWDTVQSCRLAFVVHEHILMTGATFYNPNPLNRVSRSIRFRDTTFDIVTLEYEMH